MKPILVKGMANTGHQIGVYHPKELYSPQRTRQEDAYLKSNPYRGAKYHDMLSTLSMERTSSLGDVLQKSKAVRCRLEATLRQQKDRNYLKKQRLPQVPKGRGEPVITNAAVDKNVAKRAGNDAHSKITNGGYTRTTYGGFFMH